MICLRVEVLWRRRDLKVKPLQPPAKRPRLFSRIDFSEFKELLSQTMLRGVLSYLQGGPLDTKAAQVLLGNKLDYMCTICMPYI